MPKRAIYRPNRASYRTTISPKKALSRKESATKSLSLWGSGIAYLLYALAEFLFQPLVELYYHSNFIQELTYTFLQFLVINIILSTCSRTNSKMVDTEIYWGKIREVIERDIGTFWKQLF